MKKNLLLFLIFLGTHPALFGQLEASHWYFGDFAGLDFNTNPPTAVRGQLHTEEGCSAISTSTGQLVLYTDGITIYTRNHTTMPNGTGLSGDPSSSQSGLVVPHPGDATKYFVFSVDDAGANSNGLRYSVVDITQNGGLGVVLPGQRDILAIQHVTEKVTAVANLSHNFVWVVTLGPAPRNTPPTIPVNTYNSPANTIYAIKIDNSGIDSNVIYSNIGITISPNDTHGYLKLSSDGSKIAMANYYNQTLYLLDFDINTGHASNLQRMSIPSGFMPYGVEFSPTSEILYVKGTDSNGSNAMILQYDLNQGPPYNTYNIIAQQSGYRGALQLAIDGKIYVAESDSYSTGRNFLSTINNPNQLGSACNFQFHSTNTANNSMCRQGLPQFIQSFFVQITTENVCVGDTAYFQVSSNRDIQVVNWDYGDSSTGTSGPSAGDPQMSESTHVYTSDGTYTVTAQIITTTNDTTQIQTNIEIYPLPVVDSIPDREFCDDDQTGLITTNLHGRDSDITSRQGTGTYTVQYYETQADAEADINELSDPYTTTTPYHQTMWFRITNGTTGCSNVGSFDIIVHPLPDVFSVTDLEMCDDNDDGLVQFDLNAALPDILNGRNAADYTVTFYATQADAENQTNPINTDYTNQTPGGETVYYTITDNATGCTNIGSFNLVVHPKPEINMDDQYIVCQNDSTYIEAPAGFVSYDWSTGATTQGIYVYQGGDYTVTVTDNFGCTNDKTVHVDESGPATIESISVVDFNGNENSITVFVSGPGDYEYSLDGTNYQDSNTFEHLYPGTYTVYVRDKNGCGLVSQEVDILGAPPYFTPNGDGQHEYWHVINVDRAPGTEVYIYDRFGKLMAQFTDADPGWDGTYNGVPQPATDYWFIVMLPDGRQVKGHFALIR